MTAQVHLLIGVLLVGMINSVAWADTNVPPGRTVELTCSFSMSNIPAGAKKVVAWVPIPRTSSIQQVIGSRLSNKLNNQVVQEPLYGNTLWKLDLTDYPRASGQTTTITVQYEVSRYEMRPWVDTPITDVTSAPLAKLLGPDQLVPITGKIKVEAESIAGNIENPLKAGHALFENLTTSMRYDKSGTGWGRGDALYACDSRTGNCTDFHSLFIGESRALGIPALFVAGLSIPPTPEGTINGYHCWAQFYVKDRGWYPLDASEAHKEPERKDQLFGGLDANRIELTVGRDLQLTGAQGEPINIMVYPYVEVDDATHLDVTSEYSYRDKKSGTSTARPDSGKSDPAVAAKDAAGAALGF